MAKLKDIIAALPELTPADLETLQAAIGAAINSRKTDHGETIVIPLPSGNIINL